jgi:hypothetical protein
MMGVDWGMVRVDGGMMVVAGLGMMGDAEG